MKIKLIIYFIIQTFSWHAGAQNATWKWAKIFGGTGKDQGYESTTDELNNIYNVGTFTNNVNFGNQTLSLPGENSYVAKLDSNGNTRWLFGLPGKLFKVSIDPNNHNNIYAAGVFTGSIQIGSTTLTSAGSRDCFAIRFDSSGLVMWSVSWGGNGRDSIMDLECQVDGNVNVIGPFTSTVLVFPDNISVNKIYDSSQVNLGQGVNLYSAKLKGVNGKAAWAAATGISGWHHTLKTSADMRGNIGVSQKNGGVYNFTRFDSTLQNNWLLGSATSYITGANTSHPETWTINNGNSSIDKYSNSFFDYSNTWIDNYGIHLGEPNTVEIMKVSNLHTNINYLGDGNAPLCYDSKLFGLGRQGITPIILITPINSGCSSFGSYEHSPKSIIKNRAKDWQFQWGSTYTNNEWLHENQVVNDEANRIVLTGGIKSTSSSIYIGPFSVNPVGAEDIFIAAVNIPNDPLKADAGVDRMLCNTNSGVPIGGYPTASGGKQPYTYSWSPSNGLNNPSIAYPIASPAVSTQFIVTVTDAQGQQSTDTVIVNRTSVNASITPSSTAYFCQGDSVLLTANNGQSYLWSNGARTREVYIKTVGVYTVTVTDECGNTSISSPVTVSANIPPPRPSITVNGPLSFCSGNSVTLSGPPGYIYEWIKRSMVYGQTGPRYIYTVVGTSQAVTITQGGEYFLKVINTVGCSANSDPVNVLVYANTANPVITANGATTFCEGQNVSLTAPPGLQYLWSTGQTTQTIYVSSAGSYTVTVSSTQGCGTPQTSAPVFITTLPKPPSPVITSNGPTSFCAPGQVTVSGPSGYQEYLWTRSFVNDTVSINQSLTIDSTVTLNLRVKNSYGCSSDSRTVYIYAQAPLTGPINLSTTGPTTFCSTDSVIIYPPYFAGHSYLWSTGSTQSSIKVKTSGTYFVTVSNACNSVTSSSVTTNVLPAPPSVITASGPTTICYGDPLTLSAPAGINYIYYWYLPGSSLHPTTQSISNINTGGEYTVTIKDTSNGCWARPAPRINVTINTPGYIPTITASGPTNFCTGGSVTLTGYAYPGSGLTYLWSNGATTPTITVSTSGSYTVSSINSYGCVRTSTPIVVTVNPLPPVPVITPSGPTTFCQGGSVILSIPPYNSYLWSNGATTQNITVNSAGNYSVTVSTASGCTSTSVSVPVTVNPLPAVPVITASGPTTFCQGGSVILTAPAGFTYLWSNGASTQSITVNASGSYTVTVTNGNGCSNISAPVSVTVIPLPPVPVITSSGPTTFCENTFVTLSAPPGFSYLWSTGATTQSIPVSNSGNYSVIITNSNGCSASSAVTSVTVNPLPPVPVITANGPTSFCQGSSVTLSAPAGYTYLWSNGATTQTVNITSGGNYSVTVTNTNNCSSTSSSIGVTVHPLPTIPVITASGSITFCQGGSVTLTAPAGFIYLWSTGATSQSITVNTSGNYNVRVTNGNNCSSLSANTTVTVNPLPAVPVITQNGNVLTSTAATTYQWYFNGSLIPGATAQSYTYTTGGDYTVTVTNVQGCSSTSIIYTAMRNAIVTLDNNERFYFTLFPNPVTTNLTINYTIEQSHRVGIRLINTQGRTITIQSPVMRSAGSYSINANAVIERIWTGVYILEFIIDNKKIARTILKL